MNIIYIMKMKCKNIPMKMCLEDGEDVAEDVAEEDDIDEDLAINDDIDDENVDIGDEIEDIEALILEAIQAGMNAVVEPGLITKNFRQKF